MQPPTILYPNGGEILIQKSVEISWTPPVDATVSAYEIWICDQYDEFNEPDWKQIATVPSTATSYIWNIDSSIRSSHCRIGMRSRSSDGTRSQFSVSAANFAIKTKKLKAPPIISPTSGKSYDKYIEIVVDSSGVKDTYSQRSLCQFYYSCASLGIEETLIAQNVPLYAPPTVWNTVLLTPATDYVLRAYVEDDDNNVSDSVIIKNINICHTGFFIIDTTPPEASITINSNAVFTNKRTVSITVASHDASTSIHSMKFIEEDNESLPQGPGDAKNFTLSKGDGIKKVQILLQDFGGNRNNTSLKRNFEVSVESDDVVVDIASGNNVLWAVVGGTTRRLYKISDFPSVAATFNLEPTSVAYFTMPYVGVKTESNTGVLYRVIGGTVDTVLEFTEVDSVINTMASHGNLLFLGMENGNVYSFDGANMSLIQTLSNPIRYLYSDGNSLYLIQKNSFSFYVYNGTNFFSIGG